MQSRWWLIRCFAKNLTGEIIQGKLLEKRFHSQIYICLEENKLLSNVQIGFCGGRNTPQAVFPFLDYIYHRINNNQSTLAVYTDFKKAFDTFKRSILLNKLYKLNFLEAVISLFSSYLFDCSQKVKVNKLFSDTNSISIRVPQGSTLGPLLFLIYINDLSNLSLNSKIILFTDDTVLFHQSNVYISSHSTIQNDLSLLHSWCRRNSLSLNVAKTKLMYFNSNTSTPRANLWKNHKWVARILTLLRTINIEE